MKPCECGSYEFTVEAVYAAKDRILLDPESDDFDILDTDYGDGEWEDTAKVTCCECGKTMTYSEWSNQDV